VLCRAAVDHLQEIGDKNQLVARLTEQITEAEAAHQAAKAARNEAQDLRKEAWKLETELKDKVTKATSDYDRAFSVSRPLLRVTVVKKWW
jgi:phage host-nuclease inhibitor protein Gam